MPGRNDGETIHNAVDAEGAWSTEDVTGELAMQPGESARLTFDDPGV